MNVGKRAIDSSGAMMNANPDHMVGTQTIISIITSVIAVAIIPHFQPTRRLVSAMDAITMPAQMDMPNG